MVDSAGPGGWGKPINSKAKLVLNPKSPGFTTQKSLPAEDLNVGPGQEIALRSKEGIFCTVHNIKKSVKDTETCISRDDGIPLQYSPNGEYLLVANSEHIHLRNLTTNKEQILEKVNPLATGFSHTGAFFFYVNKPEKDKNFLHVHTTDSLEKVLSFECGRYKKETWPLLHFTYDDSACVYQVTQNSLMIRKPLDKFSELGILKLSYSCDVYKLSDSVGQPLLATMSVEKFQGFNRTESKFEVYNLSNISEPLFSKVMDKAQEGKFLFSPTGENLLIWTQTTHDETGKSYYGEHQVFYYNPEKKALKSVPTYEGPIHDVAWNPNGQNFIVISGYMPAGSVLFDSQCVPKFEFGKHHRNTIKYSPLSRFLCLAGFGNLSGDMDIWDLTIMKKIGQCKANSAVYCGWSPDGRKIMTAVLNPRLRVDNNFKVFKYNGLLINSFDYSNSELYEIAWRPGVYEDRPASPNAIKIAQELQSAEQNQPKKLFQPRGGMLSQMLRKDKEKDTMGRILEPNETFGNPKFQKEQEKEEQEGEKKKKKRVRKKKDKTENTEEESKQEE